MLEDSSQKGDGEFQDGIRSANVSHFTLQLFNVSGALKSVKVCSTSLLAHWRHHLRLICLFFQVVNNFDHLNKKGRLDGDDASNGQNPKKIRHVPTPSNKKQELSTTSRATQTEHWVRMGPNPSDRRQE